MKRDYKILYDRTANLQGTLEDDIEVGKGWPSHKRGEEKRDQIMELKSRNPNATIEEIANYTGLSQWQVQRHKQKLIASGLWKICGCITALGISFIAGAYYADSDQIDEWVTERVKSPILSIGEDFLWEWEQRKFL